MWRAREVNRGRNHRAPGYSAPRPRPTPVWHSRLPGDVSLGPVQITFFTGSPLTVNSSLHVPSLSVGLTYTKGSWWIVTIWGGGGGGGGVGRDPAWTIHPQRPDSPALLPNLQTPGVPPLQPLPFCSASGGQSTSSLATINNIWPLPSGGSPDSSAFRRHMAS